MIEQIGVLSLQCGDEVGSCVRRRKSKLQQRSPSIGHMSCGKDDWSRRGFAFPIMLNMQTSGSDCKRDGLGTIEDAIPDAGGIICKTAAAFSYDFADGSGIKMRRDGKDQRCSARDLRTGARRSPPGHPLVARSPWNFSVSGSDAVRLCCRDGPLARSAT